MKRTCNGCLAWYDSARTQYCNIGYPLTVKSKKIYGVWMHEGVPSVECPKPRTNKQWLDAPHYTLESKTIHKV
jgi:hypothetical protein